jgi:hypothetical protein
MKKLFQSKQDDYKKSKAKIKKIYAVGMDFSSDASKVGRQFAFGEGALFWFFFQKNEEIRSMIIIGLAFLVLYFIFDIFQYLIGSWLNKNLGKTYENLNTEKSPLDPNKISRPENMNNPIYFCYYTKFFMLGSASILLLITIVIVFLFKNH